jgi:hypothetical protein
VLNFYKLFSAKASTYLSSCSIVVSLQAAWQKVQDGSTSGLDPSVLPSRLVTDDDLKPFCHAMKLYEPSSNVKTVKVNVRKKGELGGLDTRHYGRGKRAREVSCTVS